MTLTISRAASVGLGCFVAITGLTHFTKPDYYRDLVPEWVPAPRAAAAFSGVADVVAGALLVTPPTRRLGGLLTEALIATYLPAHLSDLRHPKDDSFLNRPVGVGARVAVNLGYITIALLASRTSGTKGTWRR